MELWFTEKQTNDLKLSVRIRETLVREKTAYQDLAVVDTVQFGRMLVLDGCVMTTERDEFVYHEMLTHVPLFTHPRPRQVLVVGGGDGGTIREILKHPSVERAVLAEIDDRVIERSRQFLPSIASALGDPRCEIVVGDGIDYVARHPDTFDAVLIDSTDPVGPAVGLFRQEFYESVARALKPDGVMAAQTESPFFNQSLIREVQVAVGRVFPVTCIYLAFIPTYPSGCWSFTIGSKRHDPRQAHPAALAERARAVETRYYTPELHRAAFALPRFAAELSAAVRPPAGTGAEPAEGANQASDARSQQP